MKPINSRFFITNNGIIYDVDTNYVFKPRHSEFHTSTLLSLSLPKNLNRAVLLRAEYNAGADLAINLNLTSACNLKCTYCFAHGGDYGVQKDNMTAQILPVLKNLILNNVTESRKVRFEYFGGEPLLNEKMIIQLVDFAKHLEKEIGIHVFHRISTNLTFLSDLMQEVLCTNNFVVSVSIDGMRSVQDFQRPARNGKSSYDAILNNVRKIRNMNPTIKTVARMTIAQKDICLFDNIKDLVNTRLFNYVSIYPASIAPSIHSEKSYKFYFDDDIKQQYREVFQHYDELCNISDSFYGVLEVEKILEELLYGKISLSHCSAGRNYYTLSSDSSIVPCHRLCGKEEYVFNRDGTGIFNLILQNKWLGTVEDDPFCANCFARYICGGGCKHEHISFSGEITAKNIYACEYRKFLLEESISNIEILFRSFKKRFHSLDNMFVYCGRPTLSNNRSPFPERQNYKIFCVDNL